MTDQVILCSFSGEGKEGKKKKKALVDSLHRRRGRKGEVICLLPCRVRKKKTPNLAQVPQHFIAGGHVFTKIFFLFRTQRSSLILR